MKKILRIVSKGENGLSALKPEHILILLFGIALLASANEQYPDISPVGQVIVLIIYLGLLVGIAPIPMPVFKSKYWQTVFVGLFSGALDSYIVLVQCKHLRTVEKGQDRETVMAQKDDQATEGVRAKLLAIFMMAALIGGLIIWFGEIYAAGTYSNDKRTGILSALYIVPPVLLFLSILGLHASRLPIEVVSRTRTGKQMLGTLWSFWLESGRSLAMHNPLLCLGGLLVYAVITRQDNHLLEVWKFHTEVNVMLVLLVAFVAGDWLVQEAIAPLHLHQGEFLSIIPAGIQAVLWGPLYTDSTVHF